MPNVRCSLSRLLYMVMNGGQRNSVLYQRAELTCLSHGAGEVALCHGGRLLSTPSISQNIAIVGEGRLHLQLQTNNILGVSNSPSYMFHK